MESKSTATKEVTRLANKVLHEETKEKVKKAIENTRKNLAYLYNHKDAFRRNELIEIQEQTLFNLKGY